MTEEYVLLHNTTVHFTNFSKFYKFRSSFRGQRLNAFVIFSENFLYAVGGQDGVQCLNHVERYDPKDNKWAKVAAMTTRRLGVAVAVLGGYLYAIGGSDGQCPLNTVERYDPR